MHDLSSLETSLNAMIAKGEMVEAIEKFYADDCVLQEVTASRLMASSIRPW